MIVNLYALMKIFNSIQILSIYSTIIQKRNVKGISKKESYVFRVFSVVFRVSFLNRLTKLDFPIPSLLEKEFRSVMKVKNSPNISGV